MDEWSAGCRWDGWMEDGMDEWSAGWKWMSSKEKIKVGITRHIRLLHQPFLKVKESVNSVLPSASLGPRCRGRATLPPGP